MVSNDPVYVDTKYGDPGMYRFYMRNIFACNTLPFIKWDADDKGAEAFLYRIQIFPITKNLKKVTCQENTNMIRIFVCAVCICFKGALRLLKMVNFLLL